MNEQQWRDEAQHIADRIRLRVLQNTVSRNGGYLSQACSSAEIFSALYTRILRLNELNAPLMPGDFTGTPGPGHPAVTGAAFNGAGRSDCDNFILSPAQYALVLYATLVETGRMDLRGMARYDQDGSAVEMIGAEHSPGMEVTTGSLGQGISQAAGIAFARRQRGDQGRVVLLMSDGECQSGEFWEAVQAMSYHKLGNMLIYVDVNGYQCDGKMTSVMNLEPFHDRLTAFGARVYRINGHDLSKLAELGLQPACDVPTFVLCDTDPCRGLPILKGRYPKFHYVRFTSEDERAAYAAVYQEMAKEVR